MIGQKVLLDLRRARRLPSDAVSIYDTNSEFDKEQAETWHKEESNASGLWEPVLWVDEADVPEHLDFRVCVGLTVFLGCTRSLDRALRLFEAIKQSNPRALACVFEDEVMMFTRDK